MPPTCNCCVPEVFYFFSSTEVAETARGWRFFMTTQMLEIDSQLEAIIAARTEELRVAKEAADAANARKSEFLANISHELRTPLHSIISFSRSGLRRIDRCNKGQLAAYFRNIDKCSNVLLQLVNQLLDSAKLEFGESRLNPRECDLTALIRGVIRELDGLTEERRIAIQFDPTSPSVILLIDHEKVAHVVRNLLSNAINVSQAGCSIEVLMSSSDTVVTVRVVDEGPGIPNEELARIYERFIQSSRTFHGAGGAGLGLAICLKTITQHGGQIWTENGAFRGAIVCFELPRHGLKAPVDDQVIADHQSLAHHFH